MIFSGGFISGFVQRKKMFSSIRNGLINTVVVLVLAVSSIFVHSLPVAAEPNDATLSNLVSSLGTLNPTFSFDQFNYNVSLDYTAQTIIVTATDNDSAASHTINGTPYASGQPSDPISLNVGDNTISIAVSSSDNLSHNTYTITASRAAAATDATLQSLTISPGTLSPGFSATTYSYTDNVDNSVTTLTVTPTVNNAISTLTINGQPAVSGQPAAINNLAVGSNTITIAVTAQDSTKQDYIITVTRAAAGDAALQNLTISPGTLTPGFSATTYDYTDDVDNTVTSVTVTPTVNNAASTLTINNQAVVNGQPAVIDNLIVGSNTITVVVTAQDGTTQSTYTISVNRGLNNIANLSGLTISSGTLAPSFNAAVTSYADGVANGVETVTVTPTAEAIGAGITVNSVTVASGAPSSPINLVVGSNSISILVTALDGITSKVYNINVTRAAPAGGGGGGGTGGGGGDGGTVGGGGGGVTGPGVTNILIYTNASGVFVLNGHAASEDELVTLTFNKGVQALQKDGSVVRSISILPVEQPPDVPEGASFISLVYKISPDGSTYTPSITISFKYDSAKLPAGTSAPNLVIAWWDDSNSKWVPLESVVDSTNKIVSAQISHFTSFALLNYARPANFSISELKIEPNQVYTGDNVSISAMVANLGDFSGDYKVTLNINDKEESTRVLTINNKTSTTVSFDFRPTTEGTYTIMVNGLSGSISVLAPLKPAQITIQNLNIVPTEVVFGKEATISVFVANAGEVSGNYTINFQIDNNIVNSQEINLGPGSSQTVSYFTSTGDPGTRLVNVNGLEASFTIKQQIMVNPKTPRINWWLIGGIILVVMGTATFVSLTVKRRIL